MNMGRALGLAFGLLAAAPAVAADEEIIKATAGYWFLAEMPAGRGCNLNLLTDQSIGGMALDAPAACKIRGRAVADASAWNLDGEGGIIFIDPLRKVLFRLKEQEDTSYTATTDQGDIALVPSLKGVVSLPTAEHATGDWQLARPGGKPLCTVTLRNEPQASGEGNRGLAVAAGCDKAIAALKLDGWMVEGVKLVLHGVDNHSLAFIDDGNDGFEKAPDEKGRPLLMRRQAP